MERWDTEIVGWNGYVAVAYARDCLCKTWLAGKTLPAEKFVMRKHFVTLYTTRQRNMKNLWTVPLWENTFYFIRSAKNCQWGRWPRLWIASVFNISPVFSRYKFCCSWRTDEHTHLSSNYTRTYSYTYTLCILCLFFVLSNQFHGARMQAKLCRSFLHHAKIWAELF